MPAKAFILLIITALLWGATAVVEKNGLRNVSPITGLIIRTMFISILLIIFATISGQWNEVIKTPLKDKILFCLSGLMAGLLGIVTYYTALKIVPVAKAVPISASYPLVAAILGVIFLGESLTVVRVIGIIFIVAGVTLVR
jgi:transporter family protein